ncbi:putative mitochondrial 54s ribosomal protein 3 [Phaeomoniella chlamydospora]|uniref:Large ribosomal subunit protein mL44 n=1 Tax=Phaeomoniella chlamydospora TaxID=158046 RepID=A0A0G2EGV8_PHACM|nr:putative mitochondrial 54s ribosomal protein 3 [Phaeomoniella chlamydospora]
MAVVYAAMWAYIGPRALSMITKEWGVEFAAVPGSEVDPGFLQFKRMPRGIELVETSVPFSASRAENEAKGYRRGMSSRSVYDDEFGELRVDESSPSDPSTGGVTAEKASTNFVRAVIGALHLHGGRSVARQFFKDHFMSRQLDMANLFSFKMPTRDLSRLCAREGFEAPVARLISETGRKSRHPVFIVGVYSGREKLGEGAGSSLDEARVRAAISALKGWYLYSPLDMRLPSDTEEDNTKTWQPRLVDGGEVIA